MYHINIEAKRNNSLLSVPAETISLYLCIIMSFFEKWDVVSYLKLWTLFRSSRCTRISNPYFLIASCRFWSPCFGPLNLSELIFFCHFSVSFRGVCEALSSETDDLELLNTHRTWYWSISWDFSRCGWRSRLLANSSFGIDLEQSSHRKKEKKHKGCYCWQVQRALVFPVLLFLAVLFNKTQIRFEMHFTEP